MLRGIRDERGITIIWVEHIMGVLMRVVDRCIVLDHGELIAAGQLRPKWPRHPQVIEVYLGTDAAQVQDQLAAGAGSAAGIGRHDCDARDAQASAPATAASRRCSTSTCEVRAGEAVAVIGPNGAGKTTLLRVISRLIAQRRANCCGRPALRRAAGIGRHRPGHRPGARGPPAVSAALGRGQPAHRRLPAGGAQPASRRGWTSSIRCSRGCRERRLQLAGTLSGGEQQMCAIGRALMAARGCCCSTSRRPASLR